MYETMFQQSFQIFHMKPYSQRVQACVYIATISIVPVTTFVQHNTSICFLDQTRHYHLFPFINFLIQTILAKGRFLMQYPPESSRT